MFSNEHQQGQSGCLQQLQFNTFFFFSVNSWNAKLCSTADGSGGQQASLSSWLPCNITFRRGEPHISIRNLIPGNKEDNGVRRKEADGGFSTCYWRKRWETEDEGTRRPIRENRVQVCQVKGALKAFMELSMQPIRPTCKCWTDYSVSCMWDSLNPEVVFGPLVTSVMSCICSD